MLTRKVIVLAVLFFVIVLCLGGIFGCQVDLGGNVSMKGMYPTTTSTTAPDGTVTRGSADPRQPMYQGSGYTERHGFGGEKAAKPASSADTAQVFTAFQPRSKEVANDRGH